MSEDAVRVVGGSSLAAFGLIAARSRVSAHRSDLDALMKKVLAQRDDNWKKLQQYILDEREQIDVRGPGRRPSGASAATTRWFIRDGFFVRSPLKVNGVTVREADGASPKTTT